MVICRHITGVCVYLGSICLIRKRSVQTDATYVISSFKLGLKSSDSMQT